MNYIEEDDGFIRYYPSLEAIKTDFSVIKCWSVVQFYSLAGRKSIISMENIIPLDVLYGIKGADGRYYLRNFRKYSLKDLLFSDEVLIFDDDKPEVLFKERVRLGLVTLLMTPDQVKEIDAVAQRVWGKREGRLSYKGWVRLVELSLEREHHKDYHSNDRDFKTRQRQYDIEISSILGA